MSNPPSIIVTPSTRHGYDDEHDLFYRIYDGELPDGTKVELLVRAIGYKKGQKKTDDQNRLNDWFDGVGLLASSIVSVGNIPKVKVEVLPDAGSMN